MSIIKKLDQRVTEIASAIEDGIAQARADILARIAEKDEMLCESPECFRPVESRQSNYCWQCAEWRLQ